MQYKWKDIVKIKGKVFAEECRISGKTDVCADKSFFRVDDFFDYLQEKYKVDYEDIETYMFDDISFDPSEVPLDICDCGAYVREDDSSEWVSLYEGDEI